MLLFCVLQSQGLNRLCLILEDVLLFQIWEIVRYVAGISIAPQKFVPPTCFVFLLVGNLMFKWEIYL